ncbi:MAG: sensor histidine kinase [Methanothermobacter wolfeii]|nr:sensor histidine kinase [Methanothermobacter wolfeii]
MDAEIDVAVSIGLIVNELVTNSIRHGISYEGAVTVKLEIMDDGAILKVSDTGKGLPEGFDIDESQGFGLRLVRFMLERINGSISLEDGDGCNFVVTFRNGGL